MRTNPLILLLAAVLIFPGASTARDGAPSGEPLFERRDLDLEGRLRQLTLEDVLPHDGKEVVIVERSGDYPDWNLHLGVWAVINGEPGRMIEVDLPPDVLFYRFLPPSPREGASLLLVLPGRIEVWSSIAKDGTHSALSLPVDNGFRPGRAGDVQPLEPLLESSGSGGLRFWIPTAAGVMEAGLDEKGLTEIQSLAAPQWVLYAGSTDALPVKEPFWLRQSLWYPKAVAGKLTGAEPHELLFFPWMDEVEVMTPRGDVIPRTMYLRRLTEEERDDGQVTAVTRPVDLNGDGRTDFLVNKYQGTAARLRTETTIHFTAPDGTLPREGDRLVPKRGGAAFAVPADLNGDGKAELAVVSGKFTMRALLRALIMKQVRMTFSLYLPDEGGYRLDSPHFSRDIVFRLRTPDLRIEGFFPKLDGDFNGDGYLDALYARDRKELSILIQEPRGRTLFPRAPSGVYAVPVLRESRIGDLNGDGRSDIVLYDPRSGGNRRVIVLLNAGRFP